VDDLLVASVAGCAGEDSASNITAATQGRALFAMRYGGVLPGAATTAPAQHVSSVAAVERLISEIGAALERRGTRSRQVSHVAAAGPEALVEHDGGFVVLGHALEHSVRGHGCRVLKYQNRIILHDNTLNLPVVARQPHPA